MQTSWRLLKWRGVPVVLSWTVFLALPYFYYRQRALLGWRAVPILWERMPKPSLRRWQRNRELERLKKRQ